MTNLQNTSHLAKVWQDLFGKQQLDGAWQVRLQIVQEFQLNFDNYDPVYIIETLIKTGEGPCIFCDSNIRAFCATGFSWNDNVYPDGGREYVAIIPDKTWFPTIKEALKYYLDNIIPTP